jgi:polyhydroxyalkanoate synthesis regulator phasin
MKEEKIFEKFINLGIGSFYYFKKNLKKLIDEIEKEGMEHSDDIEKVKEEIVKFLKMPKKLLKEFLKSCDFVTKEDFEKFKENFKNG